ncbi:MAG TPA: DUF5723 family protein, partial [Draconibacterium sp.]|nr:DUF5723 family protein [Draconibacterium sp.]
MKIKQQSISVLILLILLLVLLNYRKSYAQINGSLFMLPDNFYAQMYNPSYMRTDNATEISIPGFAGLTFINQGSFKISDIITTSTGSPVIDFDNFYSQVNPNNFIRQDFSIPLVFISKPLKKGVFSFYYKENFSSVLKFKDDVVEFLVNGNLDPGYHSFYSNEMNYFSTGYREFAFGYAKAWNDKINVGLRAKLLFGTVYFNADNWNFGVETAPFGDVVTLSSGGGGQLMLPFQVILSENNSIYSIESKNAAKKYFGAYKNPGLAIDAGLTYYINDESTFSFSICDFGGIWNRYNSFEMIQNENYDFIGFDLVSAVRYPEETGYTEPHILVKTVKDSVSQVYQPIVNVNRFISGLGPKTALHYQYQHSDKLSFGITNQTVLHLRNFQNIFTLSALQTLSNFSVFENFNVHGISDIT